MRLASLLFFACFAGFAQQALTNADIVKMVRSGVSEQIILQTIQASPEDFNLLQMDGLSKAGVSDNIIKAMAVRQNRVSAPAPAKEQAEVKSVATSVGNDVLPGRKGSRAWEEWTLAKGRPEFFGRVGGDQGLNVYGGPAWAWAAGGGTAIGLNRYLAVTGEYNYTRNAGAATAQSLKVGTQDLLGGIRVSAPSRISPYAMAGGGMVHRSGEATISAYGITATGRAALTKPAFAAGGGINVGMASRFGLNTDIRGIKPRDMKWYPRVTAGVFFRF